MLFPQRPEQPSPLVEVGGDWQDGDDHGREIELEDLQALARMGRN